MNLSSFTPDPPSLLGDLTGDTVASADITPMSESVPDTTLLEEEEISLEDLSGTETEEALFEEGQEIEMEPAEETEISVVDLPGLDEQAGEAEIIAEESQPELTLEDISPQLSPSEENILTEADIDTSEELTIDLGEISLEASDETVEMEVDQEVVEEEVKDEIELSLDDLKLDEGGNLEIGTEETPEKEEKASLEIEEPPLEEVSSEEEKTFAGEIKDTLKDVPVDLEDTSIEEEDFASSESEEDDISLKIDELELELDLEES